MFSHTRAFFPVLLITLLSAATLLSGCFPLLITGAAAGAVMASDRRTTGAYIDDEGIELKAFSEINKSTLASQGHINIVSFNRIVLVTGEVPSQDAKNQAVEIIRRIENVRWVYNELTVGPNSAITSRSNDSKITANVKQRMAGARNVSASDVKVVTEAGVVYLMGLVTQSEGQAAADVASSTAGVMKVVRLFEYLSDTDAKGIDEQHRKSTAK